MDKFILSVDQVKSLVEDNNYLVTHDNQMLSRCIDGRYENSDNLAPIGYPGGDIGQLAVILNIAKRYGLEVDQEKAYQSLIEVIGGEKNFGIHTDSHGDPQVDASGCGHFTQINKDMATYGLTKDQVDFIYQKLKQVKQAGANEIVLQGNHLEAGVLMIRGNRSIKNQYQINGQLVQVFVFHQSLSDERNEKIAANLLKNQAVKLLEGQDVDYLTTILKELTEEHLMETAKRLAKGLPIFLVEFEDSNQFVVKDQGVV